MLSWSIWRPFSSAIRTYEKLYMLSLGADALILGVMLASFQLVMAFVRFPGGYIADRYGRKKIVVAMTSVYSLAYFLFAIAVDWRWALVAYIISAFCLIYQPALWAILSDSLPPERRGVGLTLASLIPELVGLAGPPLALFLVTTYGLVDGMRLAYMLTSLAGLTAALIRLVGFRETLSKRRASELTSMRSGYSEALNYVSKHMKPFIAFLALGGLAGGANGFIQVFVVRYLGLGLDKWGLAYLLATLIWFSFITPSGVMVDRLGRRRSAIIGLALVSASLTAFPTLLPRSSNHYIMWLLVPLLFSTWFGWWLQHTATEALQADLVPRALRGRVIAITALVGGLSSALSSYISGVLYQLVGPEVPFFVCSILAVASLALCAIVVREPEEPHR